jgi:RNA methyltransferase, TrmH family
MAASSERSPENSRATSPDSTAGAYRISDEHSAARASESVTSRENRWIKLFRAALAGDAARVPGARSAASDGDIVGIEGARIVETALHSGTPIVALLASESGSQYLARFAEAIPLDAKLLQTTDRLFAQIAGTETPQGIAALVRPHAATFDDLVCGNPLVLLLVGVQDPGNVGTLIRTAEAFGATGVAACSAGGIGTANPFGPKALRASAGSALRLPTLRGVSAPILLAQLRIAGVKIYAACRDEGDSSATSSRINSAAQLPAKHSAPWEIDWRRPSALLVGNEGAGLPPELVRSADQIVRIPQAAARNAGDPMDSLNAATAGAVLLYEAARQRGMN